MGKFVIFKCKTEHVTIRNITIISLDGLYDNKGAAVNELGTGVTDLYITDDMFAFKGSTLKSIEDTLTRIDQWKKTAPKPSDQPTVGLEIRSSDFMIFHKNAWMLLRIYGDYIGLFRADLIVERGVFKVFTLKSASSPMYSEDRKTVDAFRQLIRDQEEGK